jgi:hypothetical protein
MEHREIQLAAGSEQQAEVGEQKKDDRRQIFSCGSGFPAAILQFHSFYVVNESTNSLIL